MTPLNEVVVEMLDLATKSARRYVALAGSEFKECPELFIQGYVFEHMRPGLTRSLEVKVERLWEYYCNHVRTPVRRKLDPFVLPETLVGRGKPDMVIYSDDVENKREQAPRILVEFKQLGLCAKDISRICAIMAAMPVFELGVSLGFYYSSSLDDVERIVADDRERLGMDDWTYRIGSGSRFDDDPLLYVPVAFLKLGADAG